MNIQEMIVEINNLIDDQLPDEFILPFINDAIAQINIEAGANYPFYTIDDKHEEPPFPETWQRALILTFAAGRAKEQDSSQFEYRDFYDQFYRNITSFITNYDIPEEYKSESSSSYESDILTKPPYYYGGW